jgi:predicted ATPase
MATREIPPIGPEEHLSRSGDNLPNVLQYLQESKPARLAQIFEALRARIPKLEKLIATPLPDGRLMLQMKDRPFSAPVLSRFASDGTLKLLAYLTVLYDDELPAIIGIEEPENQLHPKLLTALATELRNASAASQVVVTTHSPYLIDEMKAEEVWLLHRGDDGFARTLRASSVPEVTRMMDAGGLLGNLWMEGFFPVGDPLRDSAE